MQLGRWPSASGERSVHKSMIPKSPAPPPADPQPGNASGIKIHNWADTRAPVPEFYCFGGRSAARCRAAAVLIVRAIHAEPVRIVALDFLKFSDTAAKRARLNLRFYSSFALLRELRYSVSVYRARG
jgi:hypothetical protein